MWSFCSCEGDQYHLLIFINTDDFCECKNSDEIWANAIAQGGFHCEYDFIPHHQINCCNDTLRLLIEWIRDCNFYDCFCHYDEWLSDSN